MNHTIDRYIILDFREQDKRKQTIKIFPNSRMNVEELYPYIFNELTEFNYTSIKTLSNSIFSFTIVNTRNKIIHCWCSRRIEPTPFIIITFSNHFIKDFNIVLCFIRSYGHTEELLRKFMNIDNDQTVTIPSPLLGMIEMQNEFHLKVVLMKFGVKKFIHIMLYLLHETNLLFVGSPSDLHPTMNALLSALKPFQWNHCFIPVLPSSYIPKLYSKEIMFIGCTERTFKNAIEQNKDKQMNMKIVNLLKSNLSVENVININSQQNNSDENINKENECEYYLKSETMNDLEERLTIIYNNSKQFSDEDIKEVLQIYYRDEVMKDYPFCNMTFTIKNVDEKLKQYQPKSEIKKIVHSYVYYELKSPKDEELTNEFLISLAEESRINENKQPKDPKDTKRKRIKMQQEKLEEHLITSSLKLDLSDYIPFIYSDKQLSTIDDVVDRYTTEYNNIISTGLIPNNCLKYIKSTNSLNSKNEIDDSEEEIKEIELFSFINTKQEYCYCLKYNRIVPKWFLIVTKCPVNGMKQLFNEIDTLIQQKQLSKDLFQLLIDIEMNKTYNFNSLTVTFTKEKKLKSMMKEIGIQNFLNIVLNLIMDIPLLIICDDNSKRAEYLYFFVHALKPYVINDLYISTLPMAFLETMMNYRIIGCSNQFYEKQLLPLLTNQINELNELNEIRKSTSPQIRQIISKSQSPTIQYSPTIINSKGSKELSDISFSPQKSPNAKMNMKRMTYSPEVFKQQFKDVKQTRELEEMKHLQQIKQRQMFMQMISIVNIDKKIYPSFEMKMETNELNQIISELEYFISEEESTVSIHDIMKLFYTNYSEVDFEFKMKFSKIIENYSHC